MPILVWIRTAVPASLGAAVAVWAGFTLAADGDPVARGAYLMRAAGCVSCHTDVAGKGEPFAGGRALKTPFGTYYSPNITPDDETGIGGWSDGDFLAALRQGLRPDGSHYFPVFPYTSYTRMREADALAIKAYLFSLKPVRRASRPHDVWPPFSWRWTIGPWKWLNFEAGAFEPDPGHDEIWNRGAYLVQGLSHCGECHTPRNLVGGLKRRLSFSGNRQGPGGELVPNITPEPKTGIGRWSEGDIVTLLREGLKPDFDNVQGSMAEVIEDGLKHLGEDDLKAIARYLKSLPAIVNKVEK